ncbi:hypothetical protein GCM10027160_29110 [Streptomyces calidiresistens]|uniref:Uncharacterized protein n=1 Tax=Streptomyces calidiresistens TaxID=1485586 RepID=A0A7W3T229_9ACTN|nr:hypothetical protein [Streptomyces calidiresistens]MBB0229502.1 hypothetical protein [Streptomyces calidiresistens]
MADQPHGSFGVALAHYAETYGMLLHVGEILPVPCRLPELPDLAGPSALDQADHAVQRLAELANDLPLSRMVRTYLRAMCCHLQAASDLLFMVDQDMGVGQYVELRVHAITLNTVLAQGAAHFIDSELCEEEHEEECWQRPAPPEEE